MKEFSLPINQNWDIAINGILAMVLDLLDLVQHICIPCRARIG